MIFLVYSTVSLFNGMLVVVFLPCMIYVIYVLLWHDIACLC